MIKNKLYFFLVTRDFYFFMVYNHIVNVRGFMMSKLPATTSQSVPMNTWIMWGLASAFYAYQYVLRVLPNIMMPEIMAKFHIDATIFGQFSGLYYLGYAGMHIPIGIMLDRIGPKIIMPLSMILTAAGLLPLIFSDLWIYPSIGRALIGMGSSGAILGVFKVIRMGFPEDKFTRMLGVSVTIGLFGAIYGGRPVNYLLTIWGWESVVEFLVICGTILALLTYLSIPTYRTEEKASSKIGDDLRTVLGNKTVWTVCLLAGIMVGPLEGFADVWGAEYLKSVYAFDARLAATLPSFIFFGMCFGAPLLSYWADKTKAYYEITIFAAVVMVAAYLLLFTGLLSSTAMMVLFWTIGIMCAYQILMIYKASTYVPENVVGLTTACANMIIMVFGYFFHSTIGISLGAIWDGTLMNNVPVYSPYAFTWALSIIPIGLFIGAVGFLILRSRDAKTTDAQACRTTMCS